MVVEGGGAAGLAALLPGGPLDTEEMKGKKVTPPCSRHTQLAHTDHHHVTNNSTLIGRARAATPIVTVH